LNGTASRRIAITGTGAVCGAGLGVDAIWDAVVRGHSAIRKISSWDASRWPAHMAAEVTDVDGRALVEDRKLHKLISRCDLLGLNAAQQALADSGLSPTSIMLMIIVAYLIMGAFMDELAMILLTVPILFPVTQALGYDPVWFGVIIVVVCQAGMIAPPVGLNVFVISGMVKDVPMADIYRGILPFLAAMVVLLGILMIAPEIALYLPRTMK